MPIFEAASNNFQNLTSSGEVAFAQVNCEEAVDLCSQEKIRKYPTIKILKYGITAKTEYRGQRTVEAFTQYVEEALKTNVTYMEAVNESAIDVLNRISDFREAVIGLFSSLDQSNPHLQHFLRSSHIEKDRCSFYLVHGITDEGDRMAHREAVSNRVKEITTMKNANFAAVHSWITRKCTLPVRELTFSNAEEITDEGLPLLLLFYDNKSEHLKRKFHEMVNTHLSSFSDRINFVTADGNVFSHPLSHMGKSAEHLPFFCIDSLVHMYAHPQKADIVLSDPEHLKTFIADLDSGKLHREFHYGPDEVKAPDVKTKVETPTREETKTDPPESAFRKLGPSYMKYSILHDEF